TEFTNSGKAEVNEDTLLGLDYEPVVKLREYLLVSKRLSQLVEGKEGWMRHAKVGRGGIYYIHGPVKQSGTITHRASHINPNLAQVPRATSPYGAECRELFRVPERWVQLGVDVSGLELRCLAHYMARWDDGAYGLSVVAAKPNDVHTLHANLLGVDRDT